MYFDVNMMPIYAIYAHGYFGLMGTLCKGLLLSLSLSHALRWPTPHLSFSLLS
jgi:hypothetical protein